jgi:hypothetical protein
VKVDNCASRTMSFQQSDFITKSLRPISSKGVRGFGNTVTPITHIGTVKWRIYDDDGVIHSIEIPNSYYVPNGRSRLLSPQHWAQQASDTFPIRHGTWCATHEDSIVCHWNQQRHKVTIPLNPGSNNVGTIHTATGYDNAMQSINETWETAQHLALDSLVIIPEILPELYPPPRLGRSRPSEGTNQASHTKR